MSGRAIGLRFSAAAEARRRGLVKGTEGKSEGESAGRTEVKTEVKSEGESEGKEGEEGGAVAGPSRSSKNTFDWTGNTVKKEEPQE